MTKLKRLTVSIILISVLAVAAFAGETPAGPSAAGELSSPPCAPGELSTPPCASQAVSDDPTAPGETPTPPAANSVDVVYIAEAAFWSLLLF